MDRRARYGRPLVRVFCPGLIVALAAGGLSIPSRADPSPSEDLTRVERELEAAQARQAALEEAETAVELDIGALQTRLVELTEAFVAVQGHAAEAERRLTEAVATEAEQSALLAAERDRLGKLLSGLIRLSRAPQEALILRPERPVDTVRGAIVMGSAIPALEQEIATVRQSLIALADARRIRADRTREAIALQDNLAIRRADLRALVARRQDLLAKSREESLATAERALALGAEANTLRDLLAGLETAPADPAPSSAVAALPLPPRPPADATPSDEAITAPSALPVPTLEGAAMPVAGDPLVRFGHTDRNGEPSLGLTLAVPPDAVVVSPMAGEVRFAGPFRGYGQILILEHNDGYHSLIAGFGRIDVAIGQVLLPGEPIGLAPRPQNGQSRRATMYFELRHDGVPVNPIQGLAEVQQRGRG